MSNRLIAKDNADGAREKAEVQNEAIKQLQIVSITARIHNILHAPAMFHCSSRGAVLYKLVIWAVKPEFRQRDPRTF